MIHHVARAVPRDRLDACVDFYRLLGFAEIPVPASLAARARWLELDGIQLHLLHAEVPAAPAPAPPATAPSAGHIALVAEPPYHGTLDRLAAAGHPAESRRPHWGAERAYLRDPAGHLVELMERPPA